MNTIPPSTDETVAAAQRRRSMLIVTSFVMLGILAGSALLYGRAERTGAEGEPLVAQAQAAHAAGRHREAVIHYKNFLQREPASFDARWQLGRLYLDLGQPASALKELELAEPLGRGEPKFLADLALARVRMGQFDRALAALEVLPEPLSPELLGLLAEARLGIGDEAGAEKALDEAAARDPEAAPLQLARARLALTRQDVADAEAALHRALADEPEQLEALLLQGRLSLLRGDAAAALASFERALAAAPARPDLLAAAAEAQLVLGRTDETQRLIERIEVVAPRAPQTGFLKGWLAALRGELATAEQALTAVVHIAPRHPQALLLLAEVALRLEKFDVAEARLRTFDEAFPDLPAARRLLGAALLGQGRAREAVAALEPVVTEDTDDPALLALLSHAHIANGDNERGSLYLARARLLAAESPILVMQQALAEPARGNAGAGVAELETLLDSAVDPATPRAVLADVQLRLGDHEAALVSARALLDLRPDDPAVHNLAGLAEARAGRIDAAEAAFDAALALDPTFALALANRAALALQRNETAEARAGFEAALRADPGFTPAAIALVGIAEQSGRDADAERLLEAAVRDSPRASLPRWLLALRTLRAGQRDVALKWADEAWALDTDAPRAQLLYGYFELRGGREEAAFERLREVHERGASPTSTLLLAEAAHATARYPLALQLFDEVLERTPDLPAAQWGAFSSALAAGNRDRAAELVQTMRAGEQTDDAQAALAEGLLARSQGDFPGAAAAFGRAHEMQPTRRSLLLLSAALRDSGERAAARRELGDWLQRQPADAEAALALADLELEDGALDAARLRYEALLEFVPDNPSALNNLAWLYEQAGDPRALEVAERAHRLSPRSPEMADTLGWILVRSGTLVRGLHLLKEAHRKRPDNPSIAHQYAYALVASGQRRRAREVLDRTLEAHAVFPERSAAESLLGRLSEKG